MHIQDLEMRAPWSRLEGGGRGGFHSLPRSLERITASPKCLLSQRQLLKYANKPLFSKAWEKVDFAHSPGSEPEGIATARLVHPVRTALFAVVL